MRFIKTCIVGVAALLLVSAGTAQAGTDLNEVAAFLVFPGVVAFDPGSSVETFVTITNASEEAVTVHISFINGESNGAECYECDWVMDLTPNDTETLVLTRYFDTGSTEIVREDREFPWVLETWSCPYTYGFMTVNVEDEDGPTTQNVLLGEEVIVDYSMGAAVSVPAVSFQGKNTNNGDRYFAFDDVEYARMPKTVATDFLAPDASFVEEGDRFHDAWLTLFTLNFERQFPPLVDCSFGGYDAWENPISGSFQFGCWTHVELGELSDEFEYPRIGLNWLLPDTHGWLKLNCKVDGDRDGNFEVAIGGVHGAISHLVGSEVQLSLRNWEERPDPIPRTRYESYSAWARLLYQSQSLGDPVTLHLEGAGSGMN
jgi:hypothetical protein